MSKQYVTKKRQPKIVLVGGGTMGSVTPLLAVAREMNHEPLDFYWLGTFQGPEKTAVQEAGIEFRAISAGKWRRYFSPLNFLTPWQLLLGFIQSMIYLWRRRPAAVVAAGAFVAVPVVWAAKLLGIPVLVHQQDLEIGLANKLMFPVATVITLSLPEQRFKLGSSRAKVVVTGNPVRQEILQGNVPAARRRWGLTATWPTVLVFGGGTGAAAINALVRESATKLLKHTQLLHLTGRGKTLSVTPHACYRQQPFLNVQAMADALAVADLVVCRAGFNTLTELTALGKPAIVIPMPDSHQEVNAAYLRRHQAAVVLDQRSLTAEDFAANILDLVNARSAKQKLSRAIHELMPPDSAQKMARLILDLINL